MASSKESDSKNQPQETLRDTVRGLRHLLALLELTEERLSTECRSISMQKEVVQRLIMELDVTPRIKAENGYVLDPSTWSNYQTDNL